MKIKLDQTRTYDKDGLRRRAACLCLRSEKMQEILLVTSSRHSHLWIVPGGGLDPGEDPTTAALREIKEEAGVVGKLLGLLDVFENIARKTRTYVYVVVVEQLTDEYEELKTIGRSRRWFTLEDACAQLRIHKPVQTSYIQRFMKQDAFCAQSLANTSCEQMIQPVPQNLNCPNLPEHTKNDENCDSKYVHLQNTLARDKTHICLNVK